MDKQTFKILDRVLNKLAGVHNSGYETHIAYRDLQALMVWRDNTRNTARKV